MSRSSASIWHTKIERVDGPLMIVGDVQGVGYDEVVRIRMPDGEIRHGVVLEVDHRLAVVQVFEGTAGIGLEGMAVSFLGSPMEIPGGDGWLGRVCNGRGEPLDGGPPIMGDNHLPVVGSPLNPAHRAGPADPILTGLSAIDGLATLVRGQKLPVFSQGGLPHLELAAQIAVQARTEGSSFRIVFCAMGITHADAEMVLGTLEERSASGNLAVFINTADDPVIERILTPRLALTVAEDLAFTGGHDVLVVMADMTSYCEAVREIAARRGDVPGRRGYPGFLYSDLASIYERSGRIEGRAGSVTQVPLLTMPGGDQTHPVPDLTGYITEGQIVLSPELHARSVYPPFDAMASLSRLMRRGAGPGRTRDDHIPVATQVYAALARARQARELGELVGPEALSETDRRYLTFEDEFNANFLTQGREANRPIDVTLDLAWSTLSTIPRRELTMVSTDLLDTHYGKESDENSSSPR
jgi:V/A-type H+/Na+-transporting ATPase subunit B